MQITLPNLKWVASPNFSERSAKVDLIVVHDCEGSYAGSVAWFANQASQVSAHYVLKEDGSEATQMVGLDKKAWHACAFNSRSVGIEMGGTAARGFPEDQIQAACNMTAFLLKKFGIPCNLSEGGKSPGFCSHHMLGKAGGGHFDPTANDAEFASKWGTKISEAYKQGIFPASWDADKAVTTHVDHGIAWAQETLNKLGYTKLDVDGNLGPKTEAVLKQFQTGHHISATGKLDFETQDALANVVFNSPKLKSLR